MIRKILPACLLSASALLSLPAAVAETTSTVTLAFAGDIVPDGMPGQLIRKGKDPLAHVAGLLRSTDIRIGNLESVVSLRGQRGNKIFTFRSHPDSLHMLRQHFEVMSVANNHSGDFGKTAFADTLQYLRDAKILSVGGGANLQQAHRPLILEKNGIRIAILAYNEFMPRSFEAGAQTAGVAWSEDEYVIADIRYAIEQEHADIVIPFMHWGWENEALSSQRQRNLAHKMIDAGAAAVIGGHPHVTQETEIYRGKPIIYSLGNFLMDSLDNEPQTRGWLARLEVSREGVIAFDTRPVRLNKQGIPRPMSGHASPCWHQALSEPGLCHSDEKRWQRPGSAALPVAPATADR